MFRYVSPVLQAWPCTSYHHSLLPLYMYILIIIAMYINSNAHTFVKAACEVSDAVYLVNKESQKSGGKYFC